MNNTKDEPNQTPEDYIHSHLKRNIWLQLAHGMFGQTGFRLFNAPTFFPTYFFALTGSEFLVGLVRSLQAFGQVISPVIGASLIGHRKKILGITLASGVLMRLQMLFVALSGLFLGAMDYGVVAIMVFMTLMGFFQGIQGVMLNSLRAKVIPVNRRGFVSGGRNFLAGGTTAFVSYFGGRYFIEHEVLGDGYASIFLLAFVITSFALVFMAFTKEPESENVRQRENIFESIRALPILVRTNREFTGFLIVRALGSFGRMAMPFYILYAGTKMEIDGATLSLITALWMLTGTLTNLIWGAIGDRKGYRIVLILTLSLWAMAHIQLLTTSSVVSIYFFFVLMGAASGGFQQAGQNMILELGKDEDIPLRVAASNTAVNIIATIGPLLGGVIALLAGYEWIFLLTIFFQLAATWILIRYVPEPRMKARIRLIEDPD